MVFKMLSIVEIELFTRSFNLSQPDSRASLKLFSNDVQNRSRSHTKGFFPAVVKVFSPVPGMHKTRYKSRSARIITTVYFFNIFFIIIYSPSAIVQKKHAGSKVGENVIFMIIVRNFGNLIICTRLNHELPLRYTKGNENSLKSALSQKNKLYCISSPNKKGLYYSNYLE